MYAKSEYQPRGIPEVSRTTGTRRERQRRKELKEERGAQKDKRKNLTKAGGSEGTGRLIRENGPRR